MQQNSLDISTKPDYDIEQYRLQMIETTNRPLGSGSHAGVTEVRFMGLTCAAKKFHFRKHQNCKLMEEEYSKRSYEHCSLLGKLRHPNLVQFIGFYCEPDNLVPILVYECLHTTLAGCIESYGLMPDCINYPILKDVATALRYLHEHPIPIPHRSLAASKVLLTRDMTAKLSDIAVRNVTELEQMDTHSTEMDKGRTPPVPHVVIRPALSIELKNDIYAYGLLIIYIASGKSVLSELGALHFSQSVSFCESDLVDLLLTSVDEDHVLLELIEKCLAPEVKSRPSAITVLQKITKISSLYPPVFTNSLEMLEKIRNDAENQLNMKAKLKKLSPECSLDSSQNNELDRLKDLVTKISAQNVVLQARLSSSRSNSISWYENGEGDSPTVDQQKRNLQRQDNLCVSSPLQVCKSVYVYYNMCVASVWDRP